MEEASLNPDVHSLAVTGRRREVVRDPRLVAEDVAPVHPGPRGTARSRPRVFSPRCGTGDSSDLPDISIFILVGSKVLGDRRVPPRVLRFTSRGQARNPRVALLHGWPLDSTIWSEVVRPLSEGGLHVLCPDLPGFGDSPSIAEGHWTVEAYADEVATMLRHLGPEPVAIAGHSFGGYVALAIAGLHPGLVAGLGLISSRTIADSEAGHRGRLEAIDQVRAQGSRALLPDLARKLLALSAPPPLFDRATRILERARPEGVIAGLTAMASRPDRTEVLESYPGPVLVLHGREDQLIPEREAASPRASRAVVREIMPAAGHMPMWEAPAATAEAVLRWARAVDQG